jgi:hypothetical protein
VSRRPEPAPYGRCDRYERGRRCDLPLHLVEETGRKLRWADAAFAARDGAWVKLVLRSRAGRCAVLTRRGELCRRPAREGDVCRLHAGLIAGVKAT